MEMDKKCAKILHHLHKPSVLLGTMERKWIRQIERASAWAKDCVSY